MHTYSVFTPLDCPPGIDPENPLGRLRTMAYAHAGTLTALGELRDHVRPDHLYIDHDHAQMYLGAPADLTLTLGPGAITSRISYRARFIGTLFEETGYRELTGLNLFNRPLGLKIYPIEVEPVDGLLAQATDGRLRHADLADAQGQAATVFLSHGEIVRFVVLMYAHACANRAEIGMPNTDRIPLSDFYAAIQFDQDARQT